MNDALALSTDRQIRPLVRELILDEHSDCDQLTIYEEFAIWGGDVRADFAALNGISRGYEIKSSRDTLERLAAQRHAYNEVFDEIFLVASEVHLRDLRRVSPWWGIIQVHASTDGLRLERTRPATRNPRRNPSAIAALLWRGEALSILQRYGLDGGFHSKPLSDMIVALTSELAVDTLAEHVRHAIRLRGDWKAAARRKQCDERSRQRANRLYYRRIPSASTPR